MRTDGVRILASRLLICRPRRDDQNKYMNRLETYACRRIQKSKVDNYHSYDWRSGALEAHLPLRGDAAEPGTFVRPVLDRLGVRTEVLADRFQAGESIEELATDYKVPPEAVQDAIRCKRPAA